MYKIIGADGREYGPISAEQLRQWIVEGRANAQTRAVAEGAVEWQPLGAFPEFSHLFAPAAAPAVLSRIAPARQTNSLAVTGMILGILSVTCGLCCYGLPFNLLGLVFSIIALAQIKNHPQLYEGKGMAIAGLILCLLSLVLAGVFLIRGVALNWEDMMQGARRL